MKLKLIVVLLFVCSSGFTQSGEKIVWTGRVIDADTKEPVSYANILLVGKSYGTAADIQGNFSLGIEYSQGNSEIEVSCIGYKKFRISIEDLIRESPNIIKLSVENYLLDDLIVESKKIPILDILGQAVEKIEQNYHLSSFSFDVYAHRELRDFEINEPILNQSIVANGYYENGYKNRKAAHAGNKSFYDIKHHKLVGDPQKYSNYDYGIFTGYGLIILDVLRHENSPLSESNFKDFDFQLNSVVESDSDTIYNINFSCKQTDYKNSGVMAGKKYAGLISISLPEYVIIRFEGSVLLDKDKRFTDHRAFIDDPKFSFAITYGKTGDKYVFDYAKSSMIIYDGNSKLRFDQIFQPYNFNFDSPKRITKSNLETQGKGNPDFWLTYKKPREVNR